MLYAQILYKLPPILSSLKSSILDRVEYELLILVIQLCHNQLERTKIHDLISIPPRNIASWS